MNDSVSIGPFPWWRWAVAPSHRDDIAGIGYWSRRSAEDFYGRVAEAFPDRPAPLLLKRRGWRSYEIVAREDSNA